MTYSINASKVWFICIVHTNLSNLVGKYSSSIMKNIKYSENKHNRTRPSLSFTRKLQMVNSRKHNCDEVSKWRHSVGSSSYPYHWCWHGIKHHDAARSTLVLLVAINVQTKLKWFKSYRPLVGPIDTHGSCTAAETKSEGAHSCYSSAMCGHSTTV